MKTITAASASVACFVFASLLGGCGASMQARSVDLKNSLLVDPSILKKGTGGDSLYYYVSPKVGATRHPKIMIDPVLILKQGQLDAGDRENCQKLADNAYVYLTQELQRDYQIVQAPEPGTLRYQLAIIDADNSNPVTNILSSITPSGIGVSLVKYGFTGKLTGVGEITCEVKVTDAMTGELLGAALDRRVGGKDLNGVFDTWSHADAALKYWVQRSRYTFCVARGGTGCVKP